MTQIDRATGLITGTELSGGDYVALNINDGTGTFQEKSTGRAGAYGHVGGRAVTGYNVNQPADSCCRANPSGDVAR